VIPPKENIPEIPIKEEDREDVSFLEMVKLQTYFYWYSVVTHLLISSNVFEST